MSNLLIAKALKESRYYLARPKKRAKCPHHSTLYICCALEEVADAASDRGDYAMQNAAFAAQNLIQKRLGSRTTVVGWLADQGMKNEQITDKVFQQFRHAWVKSMIAELSGKPFAKSWSRK